LSACESQGTTPLTASSSFASTRNTAEVASQQAVAYQNNVEHTGFAPGPLKLPLKQLWSVKLPVVHQGVNYPIVANGIIVTTAYETLIALNEKTGKKLWSHKVSYDAGGWSGPAYDNGTIFAGPANTQNSKSIGMFAFDERTGKQLWSAPMPNENSFQAPPTAASGFVYTSGTGFGGMVYAYDESSGALKWSVPVLGGFDSSPVVTPGGIFVSYACPQTYRLQPTTGKQIWHFKGPCTGGGGSTPVLYDGLLFVESSQESGFNNGLILNAKSGKSAGVFETVQIPAFAHNLGFFTSYSTLDAKSIPSMKNVWSVQLPVSDRYESPPLVVGNIVYLTTQSDTLVGYDVTSGKQKVLIKLRKNGFYERLAGGLAFGEGELLVPDGTHLTAFTGS
jgi:outer membrane protein assembly factor BamB